MTILDRGLHGMKRGRGEMREESDVREKEAEGRGDAREKQEGREERWGRY